MPRLKPTSFVQVDPSLQSAPDLAIKWPTVGRTFVIWLTECPGSLFVWRMARDMERGALAEGGG